MSTTVLINTLNGVMADLDDGFKRLNEFRHHVSTASTLSAQEFDIGCDDLNAAIKRAESQIEESATALVQTRVAIANIIQAISNS